MCVFGCVCLCVFFFFFNPFLTFFLHIPSFLLLEALWICFTALSSCFLPSFHSFNVLTSRPSASLSLPLSPSFNLSSLCPSQSQSHWVSASYSSFYPPTQSPLCPSFPFSVKPDSQLLTVDFASPPPPPLVSTHYSSIVCSLCVCAHMHMSWGICACLPLLLRVCVCCVRGPAPPCPPSPERLLSGSLAFRFKLNHEDESSLFLFFFLSNASSTPPPQSAPSFFFPRLSFFIREGENEKGAGREWRGGEGRGGGAGFGFGVRKQMKAEFLLSQRYRRKLHAMPHTDTSGYSLYLKVHMVRLLLQPPHSVTHNKTHTLNLRTD